MMQGAGAEPVVVRLDHAAALGLRGHLARPHHAGRFRLAGRCRLIRRLRPEREKHGAGNRRSDRMAVAAGQGFGLVELVLNDVAALAAHRFVTGRLCRLELVTACCWQRAQARASRQKRKVWVRVGDSRLLEPKGRATPWVGAERYPPNEAHCRRRQGGGRSRLAAR